MVGNGTATGRTNAEGKQCQTLFVSLVTGICTTAENEHQWMCVL